MLGWLVRRLNDDRWIVAVVGGYMQNRTAILIIACMNNFKIISSFNCTSIANVCLTTPTAVLWLAVSPILNLWLYGRVCTTIALLSLCDYVCLKTAKTLLLLSSPSHSVYVYNTTSSSVHCCNPVGDNNYITHRVIRFQNHPLFHQFII